MLRVIDKEFLMKKTGRFHCATKQLVVALFAFPLLILLSSAAHALDCTSCHGVVGGDASPVDTPFSSPATYRNITTGAVKGNHNTHFTNQLTGVNCAKCHGSAAATYTTYHAVLNNYSIRMNSAVSYNKGAGAVTAFPQTSSPVLGSCSTANCHFENTTPSWGSAPLGTADETTCATCHAPALPTSHSHTKHLPGGSTLTTCANCHTNHLLDTDQYNHALEVGRAISLPSVGYTGTADKYLPSQSGSRTLGRCNTAYCHFDPYGSSQIQTPVWGSSVGCAACHTGTPGVFTATGAPATGSHDAHMTLPGANCGQCHTGAVSGSSGGDNHADGKVQVANDYVGSPVTKHAAGTYSGYCMNASCHASPYAYRAINSPVWGGTSGCASCHTGVGRFTNTTSNGAPNTGSHAKHMALNNPGCAQCHTSGQSGGATHPSGTVEVDNGYTASPVNKHAVGTYSGTCTNSTCHSDGNGVKKASPVWGVVQAYSCGSCHGGPAVSSPHSDGISTNKHQAHMNNYSTLGRDNNFRCAECHAKTVSLSSDTVVANVVNHNNGMKDYSGVKAGKMQTVYSQVTCANNYCHTSGQATPVFKNMTGSKLWTGAAKLNCSGCHGSSPNATWSNTLGAPNYPNKYDSTMATANSHKKHTIDMGATNTTTCSRCHYSTVDNAIANKLRDYSTLHLNKSRDVEFKLAFVGYSESYNKVGVKACATYCHSNVQAPGGNNPATQYIKPSWGGSSMTCGSCHKDMSALAETAEDLSLGSHRRHASNQVDLTGTSAAYFNCNTCHGGSYTRTSYDGATHADGLIQVSFSGSRSRGTTYSQAVGNVPANGYGVCSTSKCHGRGIKNWGVSTTNPTCEKCHGSAETAKVSGEFKDTAGATVSEYVGTHVAHLAGTNKITDPITCNQCHTVPTSINSFGHMTSLPARLVWGRQATYSSHNRAGTNAPMTPSYTLKTCNNTYCHAGVKEAGVNKGLGPNPTWGQQGYISNYGCQACHSYPPGGTHTVSTNCSACHGHVDPSNFGFSDLSKHINGKIDVTVDACLDCHSTYNSCAAGDPKCINKKLVGAHNMHTDVEMFLAGKTLSQDDYIDSSWIYGIRYKNGFPKFACGFCHPMNIATHRNGLVELDLDPSHSLQGTVKNKNLAGGPWITTYVQETSVVCNNVYCHSNGYIDDVSKKYDFHATPDWYYADTHSGVSPWNSLDRCAQCHGNSPNTTSTTILGSQLMKGSSAHDKHAVGNHYKGVFSGYSGKMLVAGGVGSGAVHGDPNTSTTFNCNLCHFDTVKVNYNDLNNTCTGCHKSSGGTIPGGLKGTMKPYSSADSTGVHINGEVDVVFMEPFTLKSKAQLRNNISAVQDVYTSWTRVKGYKTYSSYDLARKKPVYTLGTCSTVSCHNGTQMEWRTQGPLACAACHTGLPR